MPERPAGITALPAAVPENSCCAEGPCMEAAVFASTKENFLYIYSTSSGMQHPGSMLCRQVEQLAAAGGWKGVPELATSRPSSSSSEKARRTLTSVVACGRSTSWTAPATVRNFTQTGMLSVLLMARLGCPACSYLKLRHVWCILIKLTRLDIPFNDAHRS